MPKEKPRVNIGEVIKSYRSQRGLSQGDIERRTGLLRCYLSRVENGHTVPSLETLAKMADDQFLRRGRRNQRRHLANHRQHQPLVPIGKRGAEALDLREESNLILRKFAQHLLRFAVARRFGAREEVRERNVHGFRNLG